MIPGTTRCLIPLVFGPPKGFGHELHNLKPLAAIFDELEAAGTALNRSKSDFWELASAEFANRRQDLVNRDRIQLQYHNGQLHTHLTLTNLTEDQLAQICAIIR